MTDITERMNYYDGEFLKAVDFQTEQAYHVDRQRRHNRYLHTPGVADGLEVTVSKGIVTVATGTAVDDLGRQIYLPNSTTVDLTGLAQTALVIIYYSEQLSDNATPNDPTTATRVQEVANLKAIDPSDIGQDQYKNCLQLAKLTIANGMATGDPDPTVRSYAGAKNIARGWLTLPFLPSQFQGPPPIKPDKTSVTEPFTLLGAYASSQADTGAVGVMAIPIPPGATSIVSFQLSGNNNDQGIQVTLYQNSFIGGTFTPQTVLTGNIPAASPFDNTQFQLDWPLDTNAPNLQSLALLVCSYGKSDIYVVAIEFA